MSTRELLEQGKLKSVAVKVQSKRASAVESIANTTIGFIISWAATLSAMHFLNIKMSFNQLWWYTWFMTGVSVLRTYCVRRMWNSEWWLHWRYWRITQALRLHDKFKPKKRSDVECEDEGCPHYGTSHGHTDRILHR